jgi:hypothetical protein
MRKTKIITLSTIALLSLPLATFAQNVLPDCGMLGLSCRPISVIIVNLVKWLLGIFGFLAIIAFVISGIQYLVSAGDEDMQQRAKRTATYAITGVIVGLGGLVVIYAVQSLLGGQSNF